MNIEYWGSMRIEVGGRDLVKRERKQGSRELRDKIRDGGLRFSSDHLWTC